MQAVTSAQLIAVPCRVAEKRGSVAALPRKSFAGVKVARKTTVRAAARKQTVSASAEKVQEKLQVAAFTLAVALSQAGAADAAVTPSLKNLLLSVLAGGTVLAGIAVAIVGVSTFDKVTRK